MSKFNDKVLSIEELISCDPFLSDKREKRVSRIVNFSAFLIVVLTSAWSPYLGFVLELWDMVLVNAVFIFIGVVAVFLNKKSQTKLASHLLIVSLIVYVVIGSFVGGRIVSGYAGVYYWLFVVSVGVSFLIDDNKKVWTSVYVVICLALFSLFELDVFSVGVPSIEAQYNEKTIKFFTLFSVMVSLVFLSFIYISDTHKAESKLEYANERMEQLLSNILPKDIAERLKKEEKTFSDGFAECSVLFADIVGFTSLAEKMPADKVVVLLNELFGRFDELTDLFEAEKIKTIGDAYMVATGVPNTQSDHAGRISCLALSFINVMNDYPDLDIRIGINSGPVVAGIIGKKRFIYDLWGDTVNLASRMESHGVAGSIQISENTFKIIKNDFICEERGSVSIKGKGRLPVYILKAASFVS